MCPNLLLENRGILVLVKIQKFILMFSNITIALIIVAAALGRMLIGLNLYGYDEVLLTFSFWLYFYGASQGSYENSHIKADLVSAFIKNEKIKSTLNLTTMIITAAVNAVFVFWGYEFFKWTVIQGQATVGLRIPIWIPQSAIFIGLILMFIYHILHIIDRLRLRRHGIYDLPDKSGIGTDGPSERV